MGIADTASSAIARKVSRLPSGHQKGGGVTKSRRLGAPHYAGKREIKGEDARKSPRSKKGDLTPTTGRYLSPPTTDPIQHPLVGKKEERASSIKSDMGQSACITPKSYLGTAETIGDIRSQPQRTCPRRPSLSTAEIRAYYDRGMI